MVFGVNLGSPWFAPKIKIRHQLVRNVLGLFGTFWGVLGITSSFPMRHMLSVRWFSCFKTGALDWCLSFGVWSFLVDSWGKTCASVLRVGGRVEEVRVWQISADATPF
jgi:hypothetical protein